MLQYCKLFYACCLKSCTYNILKTTSKRSSADLYLDQVVEINCIIKFAIHHDFNLSKYLMQKSSACIFINKFFFKQNEFFMSCLKLSSKIEKQQIFLYL